MRAAGRVVVMRWLLVLALICAAPVYASGDPGIIDDDEPGMVGLLSGHGSTSAPASPEWTARGCATNTGVALTSLTIPNVTVAANEVLMVFYGERVSVANQQQGFTTATWGATPLNIPDNPGGTFSGSSIWGGQLYLRPGSAGTNDVTISFLVTDGAASLVGCAETVSVESTYVGEIVSPGAGAIPSLDGFRTNHCNVGSFLIGACATQEAPSADAGSWTNDVWASGVSEGGQRTGTSTATPVTLATFHWTDVGDIGHCGEVVVSNNISPAFWVGWYGSAYLP